MATHGYKPANKIGGPIVSVAAVAERLVARGHEVTVLTSDSNLTERLVIDTQRGHIINGVKVWFNKTLNLREAVFGTTRPRRRLGYLYSCEFRRRAIKCIRCADIVHLQMPFVYPTYAAAREAARYGVPYLYQQRGVFDPSRMRCRGLKKKLFFHLRESRVIERAAGLVALTEQEVASYRQLGCLNEIYRVPNGIDLPSLDSLTRAEPQFREIGLDPSRATAIFLGRVNAQKGVRILFEAYLLARQRRKDLQLIIAGPDEDGLGMELRRRAVEKGVSTEVKVIGHVEGEKKLQLLAGSQLFCLPSNGEGFSMAVLESLAVGTHVLLSPGCNFPEVEVENVGRIVPRTVEAFAAGLAATARPGERTESDRQRARVFVEENYDWERVTSALEKVYERIVA